MLTREAVTPANDLEKWTFGSGRIRGLVCIIAVHLVIRPSLVVNLARTPSAEIKGRAGWDFLQSHMVSL